MLDQREKSKGEITLFYIIYFMYKMVYLCILNDWPKFKNTISVLW